VSRRLGYFFLKEDAQLRPHVSERLYVLLCEAEKVNRP